MQPSHIFNSINQVAVEELNHKRSLPPWVSRSLNKLQTPLIVIFFRAYQVSSFVNAKRAITLGATTYTAASFLGLSSYLKVFLLLNCAHTIFQQYEKVWLSLLVLKDEFLGEYPISNLSEWNLSTKYISPSQRVWWEREVLVILKKINSLAILTFKLMKELFLLVLYLRDLYLITNDELEASFMACSDLFDKVFFSPFGNVHAADEEIEAAFEVHQTFLDKLLASLNQQCGAVDFVTDFLSKHQSMVKFTKREVSQICEEARILVQSGKVELAKPRVNKIVVQRYVPWLG